MVPSSGGRVHQAWNRANGTDRRLSSYMFYRKKMEAKAFDLCLSDGVAFKALSSRNGTEKQTGSWLQRKGMNLG